MVKRTRLLALLNPVLIKKASKASSDIPTK
jgi:hypothetical protein